MSKVKIESEEVMRILTLHENYKKGLVVEQSQKRNRVELIQFFATAKANGCLPAQGLDYENPKRMTGEDKAYIKGPSASMKGMDKRVYDDFTVAVVDPTSGAVLKTGTWSCKGLEPVKEDPNKPKPLNANQKRALEIIKLSGFFNEPAPTDVEVDLGKFDKIDLTGKKNSEDFADADGLVKDYSKYFLATDFPNGFFVYKAVGGLPTANVTKKGKIEVTAESCKTAIENLWNYNDSPRNYPLNAQEIADNRVIVETCAEPANRSKFILRFGLKDKLRDLVNSRLRIKSKI
jgi:hypothetical protein